MLDGRSHQSSSLEIEKQQPLFAIESYVKSNAQHRVLLKSTINKHECKIMPAAVWMIMTLDNQDITWIENYNSRRYFSLDQSGGQTHGQLADQRWSNSIKHCLYYKRGQRLALTLDHDHIDINGANLRLGQPLAFLQQIRNFLGTHCSVWLCTIGHHLPHCDT